MSDKENTDVIQFETDNYSRFTHTECEFYPCHNVKGELNCLFCWCPLYALKDKCGGKFKYKKKGIKDCSNCTIPHSKNGYEYIVSMFPKIEEITKMLPENEKNKQEEQTIK